MLIHDAVAAKIIAQLEQGTAPWSREWSKTAGNNMAANAITGRPYSGINTILLWSASQANGWNVPRFLTYQQAAKLTGDNGQKSHVRKGEHGTKIVLWKPLTKIETDSAGNAETKQFALMREFTVFNVSQIENLPARLATVGVPKIWNHDVRNSEIDAFVTCTEIDIREGAGEAFYVPSRDFVSMPAFVAFKSADSFYATLFHEMGHATGHKDRLARDFSGRFGTESYAAEELVAELCSAFICAEFGIDNIGRHASYIASWIRLLKAEPKAFFTAAAAAQKAVDYMRHKALVDDSAEPMQVAA